MLSALGASLIRLMGYNPVGIGGLNPFPSGSFDNPSWVLYSFSVQFRDGRLS
jgi:hypothetical protein